MGKTIRSSLFALGVHSFLPLILLVSFAQAADLDPSGYQMYSGDKFYVLADGTFSSSDEMKVRFETAGVSLSAYGGVDIRLYRVPKPIEFLKTQKNLHRPTIKGRFFGEGLSNAFSYIWDSWYKKSRLALQRIFSSDARKEAVAVSPELKELPAHRYKTAFGHPPQFSIMKEFELVDAFRYPIYQAKPAELDKNTKLEGSSSNFTQTTKEGNVFIPLGHKKPGLYLVEALIGSFRATCLVFVSDSMTVTKVSGHQTFIWSANKVSGQSISGTKFLLTDGVGILDKGVTDNDGVYVSPKQAPEHFFTIGEDVNGGVTIAEDFYYDSEIYQSKIYLFTDRPLYHSGDTVFVKVFGRELGQKGDHETSAQLKPGPATLTVFDPNGLPIVSTKLNLTASEGGQTQVTLPGEASGGGYSMRLNFNGEDYGGAFRVAEFSKPHFETRVLMAKTNFKVSEPVKGKVIFTYPSGRPVTGATVQLSLRAEKLAMHEGSLSYVGAASIKINEKVLVSDSRGEVSFELPPATDPSRYTLKFRAMDGAAFRVAGQSEILIEGFASTYLIESMANFTDQGQAANFSFRRMSGDPNLGASEPKKFEALRLEDRTLIAGPVDPSNGNLIIKFEKPGSYMVRLLDSSGIVLATQSHFVQGPGVKSVTRQLIMIADKEEYQIGEKARVLLTFPEKTDNALLTLERNSVSQHGFLNRVAKWVTTKRISDLQWMAEIPIDASFAPNLVFSVASVRAGEFSFQNKGLVVKKPRIQISFKSERRNYLPGETVKVAVESRLEGKPVSVVVAVGVVDEMIYVLQPEITPDIGEFFFHVRRNQVRTSSSQSFYSFDAALSANGKPPSGGYGQRSMKLQERARRDNIDTAFWAPNLKTDALGRAQFEFVMPDSLTRWRITGRAVSSAGAVGQAREFVASQKDLFMKWSGPTIFRKGDAPRAVLVVFNNTNAEKNAELRINGSATHETLPVSLKSGVTSIVLNSRLTDSELLAIELVQSGKIADRLQVDVSFRPKEWPSTISKTIRLDSAENVVLPGQVTNIRLKVASDTANEFLRIADDLVDYPWGCVEQTSSRLIPLTMALGVLREAGMDDLTYQRTRDRVAAERMRLIHMAGPNAVFGWWGNGTGDSSFLTSYAYLADWRASQELGLNLPVQHWENALAVYAADNSQQQVAERVLSVWFMTQIGLATKDMTQGLIHDLSAKIIEHAAVDVKSGIRSDDTRNSVVIGIDEMSVPAMVIGILAQHHDINSEATLQNAISNLAARSEKSSSPLLQALALRLKIGKSKGGGAATGVAALSLTDEIRQRTKEILQNVRFEQATIDRSLTLLLVESALLGTHGKSAKIDLGQEWKFAGSRLVPMYRFAGKSTGSEVKFNLPKSPGSVAEIAYDGYFPEKSALPLKITRKLFLLHAVESGEVFEASEIKPGSPLDSRALYLDVVRLEPTSPGNYRFGLLEVPLPPGGDIEGSTWGLSVQDLPGIGKIDFSVSRFNTGTLSYSVPIETLKEAKNFFHLVRFSEVGKFVLPPTRYFRMYQPGLKAIEGGDSVLAQIEVH